MNEVFEPVDVHDARFALGTAGRGAGGGDGLVAAANAAAVVTAADVHVARTLGVLGGETDERVLLALALTGRAVRGGSVCLDLATTTAVAADTGLAWPAPGEWRGLVAASPLVEAGVVHVEGDLVYLDRYHEQETQVLDDLAARAQSSPPHDSDLLARSLARVFPESTYDEQRAAGAAAAGRWTTVLTGGPGTGKTTAVAGLLVALADQAAARGEPIRIALAAPTGKAAARLQEAVHGSAATFTPEDRARLAGLEASTLHRLLRPLPGSSTRFRHDRGNRLPHDVVVVDESSMVSLTMMARLLEAVRPDVRVVLVGDPDQLSSVDAGAVLSDLVRGYDGRSDSPVVSLRNPHRYGVEIGALAEALRLGDADAALEVLAAGHGAVEWVTGPDPAAAVRATALPAALAIRDAARAGDPARALAALDRHRLLCAHRDGPYGVSLWNRRVEQWLTAETGDSLHERSYLGRPLLVTANDYALGVYNGDTGVVVATDDGPRVHLATSEGVRDFAPSRLGDVDTMHAMTIHRSQGSQADVVTVLLPDEESRLLTRELFYTAVTRARDKVRVVGSEPAVRAAIDRRPQRASGLAQRLAR